MTKTDDLRNFVDANFNIWSSLFWLHQKRELRKFRKYFDSVESHPLTELQRRSIILDERRNLIVAGAGTGKTSVIVAKAGYLVKSGRCKPDEILLLAYNKKASEELMKRCKDRLGVEIDASTFHALGYRIIGDLAETVPTVSKLAEDPHLFEVYLQEVIAQLRDDPETWKKVRSFILRHLKNYKPENEFKNLNDYVAYTRNVELRALSGDLVKSFAELDIANFLFLKGVKFEYEPRYPHERKRYLPDFFLPDFNIYIEHFGIDREGNAAPFINSVIYRQDMEWKRNTHRNNKTKLIETFTWQKSENVLLDALHAKLKAASVKYSPLSEDEVFEALQKTGYTTQLGKLLSTFLSHYKSNQLTQEETRNRALSSKEKTRALSFLDVFEVFYERYQRKLSEYPVEIDFNDMISMATRIVDEDRFTIPWKYIIVDEFQDISVGRYLLLSAFLQCRDDLKFFAVGDDWQSINRFAGSDISIMSNFRNFFGRATVAKLNKTFRFNSRIAEVSGRFIQKNPRQIRKSLSTKDTASSPQIFVHWKKGGEQYSKEEWNDLQDILDRLEKSENFAGDSIQILARYNHLLPSDRHIKILQGKSSSRILKPSTIHGYKGLEADIVILLGLTADKFGFPSEIVDDPLLNIVLAVAENYPHAEERRLFYVSLTRAKKQVHLVADRSKPSLFASELYDENYDVLHYGRHGEMEEICPECKTGFIEEKKDNFFACSNFPHCKYIAPLCSDCSNEHMSSPVNMDEIELFECADSNCSGTAPVCPKCKSGAILPKFGRYGKFYSCHIWPRCSYKRNDVSPQKK